jgi:hypothetical protein
MTTLAELLVAEHGDPGCEAGAEVLERYVEHELARGDQDAARAFPGWAAHLHGCPGCRTDYEGLLEATRLFGDA